MPAQFPVQLPAEVALVALPEQFPIKSPRNLPSAPDILIELPDDNVKLPLSVLSPVPSVVPESDTYFVSK